MRVLILHKRLLLIFYTKSYGSRKYQIFDLVTVFWTFLANYPAKSDIIGLIKTTGCWKPTSITVYAPFLLNKVLAFKQELTWLYAKTTVAVLRLCSIEKLGFGNLFCLSGHNLLFCRKKLWILENLLTFFLEQLEVFWIFLNFTQSNVRWKVQLKELVEIIFPLDFS